NLPDGIDVALEPGTPPIEVKGPDRERWRLSAERLEDDASGAAVVDVRFELLKRGRKGVLRTHATRVGRPYSAQLVVPRDGRTTGEFLSGGEVPQEDGGFLEYG